MTAFDTQALRNAFGTFLTGVTVVTARDAQGEPLGFTANSFSSVSLDPALLLVCLAKSSQNYDTLVNTAGFAVNILAETQVDISNTFARPSDDRFADVDWHAGPHGAPIIDSSSAWFECKMFNVVDAGDHAILIGQVMAFDSTAKPGLGYARGAYVTPSASAAAILPTSKLVVSVLVEQDGHVLLLSDDGGGVMLPETEVGPDETVSSAMQRLLLEAGVAAEPGFLYSVYEDAARKQQHLCFLCQATRCTSAAGVFVPISASTWDDVTDPATVTLLERYAAETKIGTLGIYYGNQNSGKVRAVV
ncbi:monooxygenase/reductase [Tateyamaria omphalii]|uniref:flavin reductase family protein n=1 Tax=Tateyamaria omphalii TaxID=299262 RepID=UPI00167A0008|nr:flavin reductase family protein [Tateyamaria omphalii]GGX59579.1 monooxygenase/reductase [Tateyamaria omphalii]